MIKKIIIITTIVLIITIGGTIWFYTNNSNIEYSNKVVGYDYGVVPFGRGNCTDLYSWDLWVCLM